MQHAWACPYVGYAEPDDAPLPELPKHHPFGQRRLQVLQAIAHLRDISGVQCSTCPRWYATQPWVAEAVQSFRRAEKGRLVVTNSVMADALDEIDDAMSAIERHALRKPEPNE